MRELKTCCSASATLTVTAAGASDDYRGFHMAAKELEKNVKELESARTVSMEALYKSITSMCLLLDTDAPSALLEQLSDSQLTDDKRLQVTDQLDRWRQRAQKGQKDFQRQLTAVLKVIRENRCSILESRLHTEVRQAIIKKQKELERVRDRDSHDYQVLVSQINVLRSIRQLEREARECCEDIVTLEQELRLFAENLEAVKDKDPVNGAYYQELKKLFQYIRFCT